MKKFITYLFLSLLVTPFLLAQAPTGKIIGTVTDKDGLPLPGVSVEATSPRLVGKATAVTDASGIYRFLALAPGTYKLTFTLQGFKPLIREDIVLRIEETIRVDVSLEMGALEEEVIVIGQSPLIDVKSTVKGMTLTKEMFELLPRGRNFDTLVTAVPGVNTETVFFGGGGLSVDGASSAENMFYVDGTDITRNDLGTRAQAAAFEFVEEVKIVASGYPAEFGGALGGVISVVTRQGGNEYHGELIGYYDGSRLTGKERDTLRLNPFNDRIAEYVNYQDMYGKDKVDRIEPGFGLGGYILRDKVWFFGSFLPVFLTTTRHVKFLTAPYPEGDYTQKWYWYNFQAKLTAQPFRFMRAGISFVNNFSKYRGSLPARDGTGSPTDVYDKYGFDYPNNTISAFADLTFGNNFMVNVRGGRFYMNTKNQQVLPTAPRWLHTGAGTAVYPDIPAEYQRPRGWANTPRVWLTLKDAKYKSHLSLDFSYYLNLAGEHAFKWGVQWVRQGEDNNTALKYPEYPEVRLFWNRPIIVGGVNYGMGRYGYYEVRGNEATGPFGSVFDVYNDRIALYIQDSWTIADKFTLNIGVRTEREHVPPYTDQLPGDIPKDWNPIQFDFDEKLAPRIGFIYDVFGDASLKVFGSYGLYYDVFKTYMAVHCYGGFKWKSAYYYLDTYEWDKIGMGYYPGELKLVFDWRHPAYETTDPDMKSTSQREISLGAEKMLMENLSLTVRLAQKKLLWIQEDVGVITPYGEVYFETNPGSKMSREGTAKYPVDPRFPKCPRAKRNYYGINISLDKRLANNWLAGISYTLSRLVGNVSGTASSEEYGRVSPYVERAFDIWHMSYTKNLEPQEGPLHTDRPHFLKFYGAYSFPFGLTIGTVVNAMSGTPFTETWSVLGTYWYPFNRGYYREGTSGDVLKKKRTPALWFANAYVEYNLRLGKFRLNLNVNVDNVFDVKTARLLYDYRTLYGLGASQDLVLSKNWDLDTPGVGFVQDPRWMKEMSFYPPRAVRFGAKFFF